MTTRHRWRWPALIALLGAVAAFTEYLSYLWELMGWGIGAVTWTQAGGWQFAGGWQLVAAVFPPVVLASAVVLVRPVCALLDAGRRWPLVALAVEVWAGVALTGFGEKLLSADASELARLGPAVVCGAGLILVGVLLPRAWRDTHWLFVLVAGAACALITYPSRLYLIGRDVTWWVDLDPTLGALVVALAAIWLRRQQPPAPAEPPAAQDPADPAEPAGAASSDIDEGDGRAAA